MASPPDLRPVGGCYVCNDKGAACSHHEAVARELAAARGPMVHAWGQIGRTLCGVVTDETTSTVSPQHTEGITCKRCQRLV